MYNCFSKTERLNELIARYVLKNSLGSPRIHTKKSICCYFSKDQKCLHLQFFQLFDFSVLILFFLSNEWAEVKLLNYLHCEWSESWKIEKNLWKWFKLHFLDISFLFLVRWSIETRNKKKEVFTVIFNKEREGSSEIAARIARNSSPDILNSWKLLNLNYYFILQKKKTG